MAATEARAHTQGRHGFAHAAGHSEQKSGEWGSCVEDGFEGLDTGEKQALKEALLFAIGRP